MSAMTSPWTATSGPRLSVRFGGIELRQFALGEDTRDLYHIRNHDSVRGFMTDPRPLDYDAHVAWVGKNLVPGSDVLIFLVRLDEGPIGFALLKRVAADTVEIGVMLRDVHLHATVAGQVATLMLHLTYEHFGFAWALTYVKHEHTRALALNRGLGLVEAPSAKPGEFCFRTPAAAVLSNPRYQRLMARIAPQLTLAQLA